MKNSVMLFSEINASGDTVYGVEYDFDPNISVENVAKLNAICDTITYGEMMHIHGINIDTKPIIFTNPRTILHRVSIFGASLSNTCKLAAKISKILNVKHIGYMLSENIMVKGGLLHE